MTAVPVPPPPARMRLSDVEAVMRIERVVFPTPWSARAFRYDLGMDRHSHFFVLRGWLEDMPPLLGYAGFWLWGDEAHLGTIAVHPEWQRCGLGEWLLLHVLERAAELRAGLVTLEVRVSNVPAQALYRKLGFRVVGRRFRYYDDTDEDALIMTLEEVGCSEVQAMLAEGVAAARHNLRTRFSRPAAPPAASVRHKEA